MKMQDQDGDTDYLDDDGDNDGDERKMVGGVPTGGARCAKTPEGREHLRGRGIMRTTSANDTKRRS